MSQQLPEFIDPFHQADKRGQLHGHLAVKNLRRLTDILYSNEGDFAVFMVFGKEGRQAFCELSLDGVVYLKCQNCLESIEFKINTMTKLGMVNSFEQADKLSDEYEPLLIKDEKVLLNDMIEDELLLLIPVFPKHTHCKFESLSSLSLVRPPLNQAAVIKKNPFSILSDLKKTENNNGSTEK
ncbi:MAG: YceD family protein [Methylovulum sp.]|jgi:uncharacterized protein